MHANVYFLFLVLVSATFVEGNESNRVRVTLKNGQELEGKLRKTVDENKSYYSFQGIPYAKPPLGNLRLAPPEPAEKWPGVLDATKPANTCIQFYFQGGSEDCLYLNIYTPSLEKSLPVIIWIHGGAFIFIAGDYTLNGGDFFMNEDVIFVSVHYRMGVFGFLSTEDDIIPGNFGFKDQILAINWIHENIAAFGGNPNKITLMGQSAGAVSASYFGMLPQLQGKIHGIIQQSSTSLGIYAIGRFHRVGAYILSTSMGVQTINSTLILENLRKADIETIRTVSQTTATDIAYGVGTSLGILYAPVLEPRSNKNPLLTEFPYEQLKNGKFNKIPRMIGVNSLECAYSVDEFRRNAEYYNNMDKNIRRYIPVDMNTRDEYVGHLIKKHYTNDTPFVSNITNMVRSCSDDQYLRPTLKDADLVSKHTTTYVYHFSYEGELGKTNRQIKGVDHGEELEYLFHNKNLSEISRKDLQTRKKLVKLWSNFVKYSNPTPRKEELLDNQIWLPINPKSLDMNYLDIGSKLVPSVNPHHKDVEFWDNLYDTYGNRPFDTY